MIDGWAERTPNIAKKCHESGLSRVNPVLSSFLLLRYTPDILYKTIGPGWNAMAREYPSSNPRQVLEEGKKTVAALEHGISKLYMPNPMWKAVWEDDIEMYAH